MVKQRTPARNAHHLQHYVATSSSGTWKRSSMKQGSTEFHDLQQELGQPSERPTTL